MSASSCAATSCCAAISPGAAISPHRPHVVAAAATSAGPGRPEEEQCACARGGRPWAPFGEERRRARVVKALGGVTWGAARLEAALWEG